MRTNEKLDPSTGKLLAEAAAVVRWPATAGVLVVGSRAEAVSQPMSNLNLLVLGCPPSWVAGLRAAGVIVRPMTLVDNVIVPIGKDEVSLDVLGEASRDRLAAVLASVDVLDRPAGDNLELPALDVFELRLLARLLTGVVVQSPEVVREWSRVLRVDRFRSYYVACTFLVAEHFLRKSLAAAAAGDGLGFVLRSNTAAEHLAYCALAVHGHLVYESKNLSRHVATVSAREPAAPSVLRELGGLFQARPDADGDRIQLLRRWSAELLTTVSADPSLADASRFLAGASHD